MNIPHKQFDNSFWYMSDDGSILWGHKVPYQSGQDDLRGFKSENEAMRGYLDWLDKNPQFKKPEAVNIWPGSEVFIDFDGTIYNGPMLTGMVPDDYPPEKIVVDTIQQLKAAGMKIVLYSCRANPAIFGDVGVSARYTEFMEKYCDKYDIPYDAVEAHKPHYRVLIDDRAYNGRDWSSVRRSLGMQDYPLAGQQ